MNEERIKDLICAVSYRAYEDLITAYRKKDNVNIQICERYFTDPHCLHHFLSVDGKLIIQQARKESGIL